MGFRGENSQVEDLSEFERERAEGGGAFFGASEACEMKVRRPGNRE